MIARSAPQSCAVLCAQVGDASASASPLSFGGFGSMVRHLGRLCSGLDSALAEDALSLNKLKLLQASCNTHALCLSKICLIEDIRQAGKYGSMKFAGHHPASAPGMTNKQWGWFARLLWKYRLQSTDCSVYSATCSQNRSRNIAHRFRFAAGKSGIPGSVWKLPCWDLIPD